MRPVETAALNAAQNPPAPPAPWSVIGWNTISFGSEWSVVPLVFVCGLGALGAQEEGSGECVIVEASAVESLGL